MAIQRDEALKILGFESSDAPSEQKIKSAYRKLALKYHPDKHSGESEIVKKQNEEKFKKLGTAYEFLTEKNIEEVTNLTDKNLNQINSPEDLRFYLYRALYNRDIAFLKKLFSKFKSGKDGRFGDYINEMHSGSLLPLEVAFYKAESCGDLSLLDLLLINGANPNIEVLCGIVPLHCTLVLRNSKVVELLLKHDANPNVKDESSTTPLMEACGKGYYETVEVLLQYNADFDIQDKYGNTALHKASSRGHYEIVELLLKHGAYKESESLNKALHKAVECRENWHEREKVVKLLLQYGADPNANKKYYLPRAIECDSYLATNSVTAFIKIFCLPYGSNNKVRKLMAEYGGVDRQYIMLQAIFTCCCLTVASATFFSIASPWCYIPTAIFALAACFFIKNAVHAAFFAKEPSPEFTEAIACPEISKRL
ncbi:ankyrin repeat domain-containing protein [Wolbachia endosymbiont (group B) of Agriphila straminella]|uniref:ankyrin repeat domain-containing protein n=1 Tax=Wolbachia endosymbiont (group B) of Agriphila straminella TaxID=2953972 RepID=UPI0029D40EBF|nr:ankyrin repeat domain-containing protein [Wolbachia endosymbiont (group B) of Agriphila straminella]